MSDQPNQPTNPLAVADATLFSEAEVAEKPKGLFHCRELILANGNAVLVGHNMSTGDRVIRFTTRGTPGGGPVIHPFSLTVQAAVALATQLESSFRDVPYHGPSPIRAARGGSMTLTEGGMPEGAIWGPTYQATPAGVAGVSARPEPTRREHIVQLNSTQTERLRKWLTSPNGSHRPSSRVGFEAVSDGGLLVRTMPYESEEAERADRDTARAVTAFADGQSEKQMIDNFDWLYRKMREAWVALAKTSRDPKRRIPPTWQQLAEDVVNLAKQTMPLHCTCSDPSNDKEAPCDWCCVERYPKLYQEAKDREADAFGASLYLCEAVELMESKEADDSDFDRFVDKVEADKGFTAMRERLARIKAASDEVDAIRVAVAKELAADGALANPDDLAVSVRSMVRRLGEWRAVAGRWDEVDAEVRKHPEVRIGCNVQDEAARLIRSHAQLAKAIDEQMKAGARVVKPGETAGNCKPCKSLTCPDCGDDKLADDSGNGNPGWHRCHCGQLHKQADPRQRLVELAGELYRKYGINPEQYPWFAIDEDGEAFAYASEPGTRGAEDSYWYAAPGGHDYLTTVPRRTMVMLPPWTECLVRMDGPENDSAKRAMEAEPKGAGERVMTAKDFMEAKRVLMEARRVLMETVAPDQPGGLGMVENKNSASPIQSQTTGESPEDALQQEAAQCRADRKVRAKRFSLLVVIWCGTLLFLLIAGAAVWRIFHRMPLPF